ncbi:MAG: hypothetical protein OEZ59_09725 [Deltaproteobacteria bacterium]|nr:hypothetical protein [Deltaproteobacteria bacterium]
MEYKFEKITMWNRLTRAAVALAFWALLLALPAGSSALAYDAGESDAFYIGGGSSNIEMKTTDDIISGQNILGGVRIGLFWTFFLDFGYGAIQYWDKVDISGVKYDLSFRTTGAHYGIGTIIPVRKMRLGVKALQSPNNRWEQELVEPISGAKTVKSGSLTFLSTFAFVQFTYQGGSWELGARRDLINDEQIEVSNSFGPYLALNIQM